MIASVCRSSTSGVDCRRTWDAGGITIVENSCTILQIWETGDAGTSEEAAMDLMNRPQSEREVHRAQAARDELAERVARAVGEDGDVEAPGGLRLHRRSAPTPKDHGVSSPAFCVIAQGEKEVLLGDESYRYDADRYLIAAAALPTASRVIGASEERPYLGLVLGLDPALVGSVMVEAGHPAPRDHAAVRAIDVSPLDSGLLDAVLRLLRLLDAPADEARFLRPLITREIVFRLLKGEQGGRLGQIAVLGGHAHRIARAIERLREDFDQPLRIEDIARESGMSVSGFHHHFRAVTAMSPLQFQKRMRLQEARRLMLGEDLDAASAGYRVGYSDASHFTREYKRLFGAPPVRDVERLREGAMESAGP
jgi:AraC-like DNA-binding protein